MSRNLQLCFLSTISQSVVPQRFQFPDQLPLQYAETLGLLVFGNDERQRRTNGNEDIIADDDDDGGNGEQEPTPW